MDTTSYITSLHFPICIENESDHLSSLHLLNCVLELLMHSLHIKQMARSGYIDVENLTEMPIVDAKEAGKLYLRGSRSRSTAWTNANESSSRSHWWVLKYIVTWFLMK